MLSTSTSPCGAKRIKCQLSMVWLRLNSPAWKLDEAGALPESQASLCHQQNAYIYWGNTHLWYILGRFGDVMWRGSLSWVTRYSNSQRCYCFPLKLVILFVGSQIPSSVLNAAGQCWAWGSCIAVLPICRLDSEIAVDCATFWVWRTINTHWPANLTNFRNQTDGHKRFTITDRS